VLGHPRFRSRLLLPLDRRVSDEPLNLSPLTLSDRARFDRRSHRRFANPRRRPGRAFPRRDWSSRARRRSGPRRRFSSARGLFRLRRLRPLRSLQMRSPWRRALPPPAGGGEGARRSDAMHARHVARHGRPCRAATCSNALPHRSVCRRRGDLSLFGSFSLGTGIFLPRDRALRRRASLAPWPCGVRTPGGRRARREWVVDRILRPCG